MHAHVSKSQVTIHAAGPLGLFSFCMPITHPGLFAQRDDEVGSLLKELRLRNELAARPAAHMISIMDATSDLYVTLSGT